MADDLIKRTINQLSNTITLRSGETIEELFDDLVLLAQRVSNNGDNQHLDKLALAAFRAKYLPLGSRTAGFHNSIFRGKDITGKYASGELYTQIANGTFDDLYVGDYFITAINGTNYTCRIAGFDSCWNDGDSALQTHHIVIVCDETFSRNVYMESSNITSNGYAKSYMNINTIGSDSSGNGVLTSGWNQKLYATFGSHLCKLREILCNSASSGTPNGWAWVDVYAALLGELEVYGGPVWGKTANGTGYNVGVAKKQLPLFGLAPQYINPGRYWYWLRDVVSSSSFAYVSHNGYANDSNASLSSSSGGLRPRFLLKG